VYLLEVNHWHSPDLDQPVTARHVPVEQLEPSWHALRHVPDAHA